MLTNNEMKDGLKCSLLQPPDAQWAHKPAPTAETQLTPSALSLWAPGQWGHGAATVTLAPCLCTHVWRCGRGALWCSGGGSGPCGPGAPSVQLPLPSASRVSVRRFFACCETFPLTTPAQYVFKGASFQTPAKLLHLPRPVCILSDLASGAQHCVLEVYPRGRGCRSVFISVHFPCRGSSSCLGSVPLLPGLPGASCRPVCCCLAAFCSQSVGCLQWALLTYLRFSHGHPLLLCTS